MIEEVTFKIYSRKVTMQPNGFPGFSVVLSYHAKNVDLEQLGIIQKAYRANRQNRGLDYIEIFYGDDVIAY